MSGLLLGFSGKMASGKSTTAKNILTSIENSANNESNGTSFKVVSFADELRKEVSVLISHAREVDSPSKYSQHELFSNVDKRIAKKLYNFILSDQRNIRRTVMQVWGTDVRRANNEKYWVEKAIDKALLLNSQGVNVGVDDVRFENEAMAILENSGILVRLDISPEEQHRRLEKIRNKQIDKATLKHSSEIALDNFPLFSLRVDNNDSVKAEKEIFNYLTCSSNME